MEQPVFLHNLSVLKTEIPPEWVVYQEVYEVQGKMYMRGVTAIDPTWLPDFCPMDCNLSKPLSEREPFFDQERGQVLTFRSGTEIDALFIPFFSCFFADIRKLRSRVNGCLINDYS